MRFRVYDPEVGRDNPVEAKHRRLVRSQRNGVVDKDLKPNAKIRDELNEILTTGRHTSSRPTRRIYSGSSASTSRATSAR